MTSTVQGLPLVPASSAPSATPHASSQGYKSRDYRRLSFARLQRLALLRRVAARVQVLSVILAPLGQLEKLFKSATYLHTVSPSLRVSKGRLCVNLHQSHPCSNLSNYSFSLSQMRRLFKSNATSFPLTI